MKKLSISYDVRIGNIDRPKNPKQISKAHDVYEAVAGYADADREVTLLVMLDTKNNIMSVETHSIGTIDSASVYPREIFRSLLLKNATSFIMVHNHPSGDPTPSAMDRNLTGDVKKGSELIGIKLLDHIILGDGSYFSFCDHGELV